QEDLQPTEVTLQDIMGLPQRELTDEDLALIWYRPTLVLGVGGTGLSVVRKLKRRLFRYFPPSRRGAFQYLVIDTDAQSPPGPGEEWLVDDYEFFHVPQFSVGDVVERLGKAGGDTAIDAWWPRTADDERYRTEY